MTTVWNAEGVDFGNFHPVTADYGPRDLHAVAAMVTQENIGQWALEFEQDLNGQHGAVPFFGIQAEREGQDPITLTIKPGFWIVKVWNELHVFKDGLFQNTFSVPKEQLIAVRKAHYDKVIQNERDWQAEQKEVQSVLERELEQKFEDAMCSGDWSNLDVNEKRMLRNRLADDEEFKTYVEAARLAKVSKHIGEPSIPIVGPDYNAEDFFSKADSEKTQIVPAAGNLYPEGEGPVEAVSTNEARTSLGYEELRGNRPVDPLK